MNRSLLLVILGTAFAWTCGGSSSSTLDTGTLDAVSAPDGTLSDPGTVLDTPATTDVPPTDSPDPDVPSPADVPASDPGQPDTVAADPGKTSPWGVSWDSLWPTPDQKASYLFDPEFNPVEMEARLEYDTQFEGAKWDRLVVGTPEPKHDGAEVFFSRATPWQIRVKQVTIYRADQPGSPAFREYYETPFVIPLDLAIGEKRSSKGTAAIYPQGLETPDVLTQTYDWTVEAFDASVDVAAGTQTGCMKLHVEVGAEGETGTFPSEIWIHPKQLIVKWTTSVAWSLVELKTPWK